MTPHKFYDYDCTKSGRVKSLKIRLLMQRLPKGLYSIEFVMSHGFCVILVINQITLSGHSGVPLESVFEATEGLNNYV